MVQHCKGNKVVEFLVEILFSNTEDPDGFFSIGHTEAYIANENMEIEFNEEFEFNYLFQRTQHVKFVIFSDDGKQSEITINLSNVIFNKLKQGNVPIDLLMGQQINYEHGNVRRNMCLIVKFQS